MGLSLIAGDSYHYGFKHWHFGNQHDREFTQIANKNEFRRAFAGATIHDMFNWLTVFVLFTVEIVTRKSLLSFFCATENVFFFFYCHFILNRIDFRNGLFGMD